LCYLAFRSFLDCSHSSISNFNIKKEYSCLVTKNFRFNFNFSTPVDLYISNSIPTTLVWDPRVILFSFSLPPHLPPHLLLPSYLAQSVRAPPPPCGRRAWRWLKAGRGGAPFHDGEAELGGPLAGARGGHGCRRFGPRGRLEQGGADQGMASFGAELRASDEPEDGCDGDWHLRSPWPRPPQLEVPHPPSAAGEQAPCLHGSSPPPISFPIFLCSSAQAGAIGRRGGRAAVGSRQRTVAPHDVAPPLPRHHDDDEVLLPAALPPSFSPMAGRAGWLSTHPT
jgi:hypothetical protein